MAYPSDAMENEIEKRDRLRMNAIKNFKTGDMKTPTVEFTTNKAPKKKSKKKKKSIKKDPKKFTTDEVDNFPMDYNEMSNEDMYPDNQQKKR